MPPSLPNLKVLSTHASTDTLGPINSFRLFTGSIFCMTTHLEHIWGLEKGQLDLWSSLNHISVRADVAPLFYNAQLMLIPSKEVLDQMQELVLFNKRCPLNERRKAFEVFPPKKYEYRMVSVTDPPPTLFATGLTSSVEPLLCVYPDFPLVKLNVHPAFAMIHSAAGLLHAYCTHLPFYATISIMTTISTFPGPRSLEFQSLPEPNDARGDDSSEGGTVYEDDSDSEGEAVKIHSWLDKADCLSPSLVVSESVTPYQISLDERMVHPRKA